MRSFFPCLAALVVAGSVVQKAQTRPVEDPQLVRGVTISTQTSGREWGEDAFGDELDELVELGVNWVAVHPYAWIRGDGSVRHRLDPDDPPRWLTHPLAAAKERGVALLVKPHLGYWGSSFAWRGDIHFEDPTARERFWREYRAWIDMLAGIVREADAFCVGTELDRMLGDEDEWRALIAQVRARTAARLTYAANWDAFERVSFWDALDAVGLQAYFPLSDLEDPDEAALEAGWAEHVTRLRGVHRRTGKPVVFTELGYTLSLDAARRPWEDGDRLLDGNERARAAALQARCLKVALGNIERERDWLRGAFLWKWFVGEPGRNDASFLVDAPHMRTVLTEAW